MYIMKETQQQFNNLTTKEREEMIMVATNVMMAIVFGAWSLGFWTAIAVVYAVFRKEMKKRA